MSETLCRCWTEPARTHSGHCCMATAGQTCHQVEGMAALAAQEAAPCDTGTPDNPCKGCPDCMGIPSPRHCHATQFWTGTQCILNAEHAGPHK